MSKVLEGIAIVGALLMLAGLELVRWAEDQEEQLVRQREHRLRRAL